MVLTSTVRGRPGVPWVSGEANLVVADDVDGAVGGVVRQVGQVEGLIDNTLAREGSVTVE